MAASTLPVATLLPIAGCGATGRFGCRNDRQIAIHVATRFERRAASKIEMSHHGAAGGEERTWSGVR